MDQAGRHPAKPLQGPGNIRLLPQPAHSPELNPAEPLWEERREKALANRSFESLEALMDTWCEGLMKVAADEPRLRSMTDFPYLRIDTS